MKLAELQHAGRAPALPLSVDLGADSLEVSAWLRVLPGQRYVGLAQRQGRAVLAKLLVGAKAERHFARERDGAALLAASGLDTPALLAEGFEAGQGGWLLFEFLDGAQSLWDAWRAVEHQAPLSDAQQAVLGEALAAIARLHAQGLWQSDLHLDNLLRHDGRLFLIDGGGVQAETPGQPLSRARALENLGVFFAQLPARLEPFFEELLVHYLLANGEHALPLEALLKDVARVRRWRLRDYLQKAGRDCSLFSVRTEPRSLCAVRRDEQDALAPLLADPDAFIRAGQLLKDGGSATVAKVEVATRQLLVKRYNVKGLGHWLRRCLRPSRAWHSWIEGNRLEFLGIATPRPLACIERRFLGLRRGGWLINVFCEAGDLFALFGREGDRLPSPEEAGAIQSLFADLARERISHGDLKATNLLWDAGHLLLIDLDALRAHPPGAGWQRAQAADRARFIRNWPADSPLARWLEENLPSAEAPPPAVGHD
ncbi:serine/threonine protein kinase [Pseudomonas kuykendallii]|uniref:Lipopolysaccharide kinase (Kdo/WaaP) family protein n=1 Tax=Pseudomonas kuykendallii TaxID=1007099 RepID=A0A1H2VXP4_9PSED|nr:lipopolysaccharide kinase InaA family protein [Pseudomonas kuykendallii]MCQ4272937.1 serine/threonine protein kinase [Pseudomonas kuykendallii]SDW73125.1 Lipopolysaccharide kinase (Kdo/WaaP) family protein [Pseudomonas kuykendallii]